MAEKTMNIDYAGNSRMSKDQSEDSAKKDVEKIAAGKLQKKTGIRKFTDTFLADDISSVGHYLVADVLIPAAKEALVECVNNGINALIYGNDSNRVSGRTHNTNAGRVSYRRYYDDRDSRRNHEASQRRPWEEPSRRTPYDAVILDTRQDAVDVLNRMYEILLDYGRVSVCDLYDLVGVTTDYTSSKYGWINIDSACIVKVREGFLIDLPKPMVIDYE